jgi:hypothetical protein
MGDAQLLGSQQLDDPPAQRVPQRAGQFHRLGGGVGWSDSGSGGHGHLNQSTLILIAGQGRSPDLATHWHLSMHAAFSHRQSSM